MERGRLSTGIADGATTSVPRLGNLVPKACENCRIRKIRCDKLSPCSSCRMVNLPCRIATRTSEKSRQASSSNHEKYYDLFHQDVRDIKEMIQQLSQGQVSSKPRFQSAAISTDYNLPSHSVVTFQGESSFSSYLTQASHTAESSARDTDGGDIGHQIRSSLSTLKSLLRNHDHPSSADSLSFPHSIIKSKEPKIDLPPLSAILAVLKRTAAHAPFVVLHSAQRHHSIIEDLCRKVYFPSNPFSMGELTLMNGMLSFVFAEYSINVDASLSSSDCITYAKLCEENFIAGLQDYECLVTPSLENIQCLMIGAMKAQEESRPSLCWTFVSAGARLCQILGYHREAIVARDPPKLAEAKRHAFWMLYMIDKTMSLNLGRTSCFPDDDIDVNIFLESLDPRFRPWDRAFIAFIEFSKLQGRIYNQLYTIHAQREPPESRSRTVQELTSKFSAWREKFREIDTAGSQDKNDLDLIINASDFIYYSALNLLYGAKTTPGAATHISSQRYECARLSLQCHIQNCAKLASADVPKWRIYSDWILLYSSFTPFLVVFTHAIASQSKDDVELLFQVLNTLEAPRKNTEALNRLYQVCKVFVDFAKAFIQSQQPLFGFYNAQEDSFTFSLNDECTTCEWSSAFNYLERRGSGAKNDELESMSAFLGSCLGENSALSSLWNMDIPNFQ